MLTIKKLDWDSEFFGLSIARVVSESVDKDALSDACALLKSAEIALGYLFLSEEPLTDWPEELVCADMGGKVLYYKKIFAPSDYHPQISSYPAGDVAPELYELALQSGVYSRFKLDTKLPENAYERLYRAWIEKSVQRILADELLVFRVGDKIAGMVTLAVKDGWGDIGLIAVDTDFRGQKIGHHLLNAAYKYFYDLGIADLGVETQTQNEGACRFYENNGFVVNRREYIYHLWL